MTSITRHALVTGGTRGIGFEISKMFLQKDYEVVFTGRTQESVDRAIAEYHLITNDYKKIQGIVFEMSKFPPFHYPMPYKYDTIIHNAGMLSRDSLLDMNDRKLDKMFTINAMTPMYLSKMCLPYMIQQNHGNIFFFCPPYRIDAKTRILTPYMQTKLAQTTFMYSMADMVTNLKPRSGIKIAGFWTDYPIYTDALIHRKIGVKEDCMNPGIIAKTVELMLDDDRRNIHGNVMIDRDYLRTKRINTSQWAYGNNTKKLDSLFLETLS
jgi:short-subunit dehydrogenase